MIHLLIALLAALLLGCGYDPDCFNGCSSEEPEVVYQTTEVTKTVVVQGQKGDRGETGPQGATGPTGAPGARGSDGTDAVLPPNTIVDIINPCGPANLDEVILVTAGGTLIAHYSDGQRQHLTVLVPGRYTTTDSPAHACNFSVDNENNLTWED